MSVSPASTEHTRIGGAHPAAAGGNGRGGSKLSETAPLAARRSTAVALLVVLDCLVLTHVGEIGPWTQAGPPFHVEEGA